MKSPKIAGPIRPASRRSKAPVLTAAVTVADPVGEPASPSHATRGQTLIAMMRAEGGASAHELAGAIGWRVHSVRGFIAGTLKKRSGITVSTSRSDGITRYYVRDIQGGAA